MQTWTTKNSLPSLPKVYLDELWQRSIHSHHTSLHHHITHKDITRFKQLFPEAIFHNEDKRATSLRIYCPVIYFQCLTKTFADPLVFRKLEDSPNYIIEKTIAEITKQFGKSYPWALGSGRDLPNAYVLPKRKNQFLAGQPIASFFTAPFRPMLNCIAKMIYHKLFPTTLQKEMSSIPSSFSKTPILTISLHHVYTIRTLLASSRASTLRGSSTAGDSPCSFFLPS